MTTAVQEPRRAGKLGKHPRRDDPRTLSFRTYRDRAVPAPPASRSWDHGLRSFGAMRNDEIGDCLLPGTIVTAGDLQQAYRVPYDGPIVTLTTASGKRLSVTANHAVLTSHGFVRACDLREGDDLISSSLPDAVASRVGHNLQHAPARVEDLFKAFGPRSVFRPAGVMTTVDFHGDERFFKGQVNIVSPDGLLQTHRDPALHQPVGQHSLIERSGGVLALDRKRTLHPSMDRILRAAPGLMGGVGIAPLLLRRPPIGTHLGSLTTPTELYASVTQPARHGCPSDIHLPGEFIRRFPGLVEVDHLTNIDRRVWSGHVYDASTNVRWYSANGIITHNCTCAAIGHALQITSANTATEITVSDAAIVAAYSAVSGYDPRTGANDVGANMLDVQKYWQQTGVAGHKAVAFAACSTANLDDVKACINLFGFCNIGFQVPAHCIPDFEQGKTWDVQSANSSIIGGHDVILVDYDDATSLFTCITWGGLQKLTYAFFHAYVDEAYGVVLPEWIAANGEAPSGFDLPQLLTDVQELTQAPDPAPQPAPTPPPAVKTLADYDAPIKGVIQSGVYDLNAPDLVAYQLAWWQWAEGATVMKPDYQLPSRPHLAGSGHD